MTDLFDLNKGLIEAYGQVNTGWKQVKTVSSISGHDVDLVRNLKPDNTVEFYSHIYKGPKKVDERKIFDGHVNEVSSHDLDMKAKNHLLDYLIDKEIL